MANATKEKYNILICSVSVDHYLPCPNDDNMTNSSKPQPSTFQSIERVTALIQLAMLLLAFLLPTQDAAEEETAPPDAGLIGHLADLNWKARHEAKLLEA